MLDGDMGEWSAFVSGLIVGVGLLSMGMNVLLARLSLKLAEIINRAAARQEEEEEADWWKKGGSHDDRGD